MEKNVSLSSLLPSELESILAKHLKLSASLSNKLPDGGAKLNRFINKVENILLDKKGTAVNKDLCCTTELEESGNLLVTNVFSNVDIDGVTSAPDNDNELRANDVDDLSIKVSALSVSSDSVDDPEESYDYVPVLSPAEFRKFQRFLDLPTFCPITFNWFIFSLRRIGSLVYLVAVDCSDVSRQFVRTGLWNVWFPNSKWCCNSKELSSKVKLDQPAEALSDFWKFITYTKQGEVSSTPPCLIGYPLNEKLDDLQLFSHLICNTRHSSTVRILLPRDCRFVNGKQALESLSNSLDEVRDLLSRISEHISSQSWIQSPVEYFLRYNSMIADGLFVRDRFNKVELKYFTQIHEFLTSGSSKTMTWMEAPLELSFLRQIKFANIAARNNEFTSSLLPNLAEVPNCVLRRLALSGLGRARLIRLAAVGKWNGFSGFLSYRVCNEPAASSQVLVSDEPELLKKLYLYFKNVHIHLVRHERCFSEDPKRPILSTLCCKQNKTQQLNLSALPYCPKIQAWTSNADRLTGRRQLCLLNTDQSLSLMRQVQNNYEESRIRHSLPDYPTMPPVSAKLTCYRNSSILDDSPATSMSSSDSDESDGYTSLGLEEVD